MICRGLHHADNFECILNMFDRLVIIYEIPNLIYHSSGDFTGKLKQELPTKVGHEMGTSGVCGRSE